MATFRVEIVTHDWKRFDEVLDLYFEVLYGPFGVPRDTDWYHEANGSTFAVAVDDADRLVGAARLLPPVGEPLRQVRQVAVAPDARCHGVGRELMTRLERIAAEQGARELWLNARHSAYGFYEALGWRFSSDVFTSELTGIPHREMRRELGEPHSR